MTWIVIGAKTKKELKEKLASGGKGVSFEDPSIFKPLFYTAEEVPKGFSLVCTNHPKRSWFAKVERTEKGFRVS